MFRSSGDTEVLLAAYRQWGAECLHRLNGMWAFVIYDRHTRRIFAARDRFGVKPLFWSYDARGLVLASEIKAVRDSAYARCVPNERVIARFLVDGEIDDSDQTFYADVQRVPAGSYFEGDATKAPDVSPLSGTWRRPPRHLMSQPNPWSKSSGSYSTMPCDCACAPTSRPACSCPEGSTRRLSSPAWPRSAPRRRHPAGLEALCYLDPEFDEQVFIDATLKQTHATLKPLDADPEEIWKTFEHHLWHQDEPVHSFTSAVVYQLMKLAQDNGLKVILNGQGADEALAGYPNYFVQYWSDLLTGRAIRRAHSEIMQFARAHERSPLALHAAAAWRSFNLLRARVPGHRALATRRHRFRVERYRWLADDIKESWMPAEDARRGNAETGAPPLGRTVGAAALFARRRSKLDGARSRGAVALPGSSPRYASVPTRSHWKLRGEYTKFVLRAAMRGRMPEIVRTRVTEIRFPDFSRATAADRAARTLP